MNNQTVSSKIGEDYREWTVDKNIILDMAMGRGKTFFIVNVLGEHARASNKSILYLCNRSALSDEVFKETKDMWLLYNIEIMTYQMFQSNLLKDDVDIKEYDYIVCDECHYLLKDAWNDKTDIMYKWLKNNNTSVKVFMSATGHNIFPYIRNWGECIEYKLEPNYSYIKKIVFYDNDSYINRVIEQLEDDEKLLYFSRKIDKAYNVHNAYKDKSSFICSKYTKHNEYKDYITNNALNDEGILLNKITTSTSVWDNGINVKDKQLKHIICDFEDLVTLIQAIGRKRVGQVVKGDFILSQDDELTLHIKKWSKENLNQFANPKRAMLNETDKYINNDIDWLIEQRANRGKRITDCLYVDYDNRKIEVNYLRLYGIKHELDRLKDAIQYGFDKYVIAGLGDSFNGEIEYISIEEEKKKDSLELFIDYLNNKVATRLFKDDQEQLKLEFAKAGLSVDGERTMGMKTMNAFMEENDIPFRIESSRITVDGKKHTIWTILQ